MRKVAVVIAALLALAPAARAEVSVLLNSSGEFSGYYRHFDPSVGIIWTPVSSLPRNQMLNPQGDALGDATPACSVIMPGVPDCNSNGGQPWPTLPIVVWPRSTGGGMSLVYSVFRKSTSVWDAAAFVEPQPGDGNDLDPRLAGLHAKGLLVWWRGTPNPAAYRSTWTWKHFTPAVSLTPAGIPAAHPVPFVAPNGRVYAGFENLDPRRRHALFDWIELTSELVAPPAYPASDLPPAKAVMALPTPAALDAFPALAVWPQRDGGDYDLVYSRWDDQDQSWSAPARVVAADDDFDDLEPALLVTQTAALLVWTRHAAESEVYISRYNGTSWSMPMRIGSQLRNPVFLTLRGRDDVFLSMTFAPPAGGQPTTVWAPVSDYAGLLEGTAAPTASERQRAPGRP